MKTGRIVKAVVSALLVSCTPEMTTDAGTGGGSATGGGTAVGTIVDVAAANADLTILLAAVQKAGLASALSDTSANLTVFAPTNTAFQALLTQLGINNGLDGLTPVQLAPILRYHVLGMRVDGAAATTAAMSNATVARAGELPDSHRRQGQRRHR